MANSKKTNAPAEPTSEKACPACGHANSAEATFCGSCGGRLDAGKQCRNCGAPVSPETKFCTRCGCPTAIEKVCHTCGAKVGDNYKFCPKCGASAQGNQAMSAGSAVPPQQYNVPPQYYGAPAQGYQPAPSYAPPAPPKPKTPFRQRVVEFENRRHLMSNLVVLVMSFIFLLVALFAPIEVAVSGVGGMGDGVYGATNSVGIDQTIYQVFDAYEYIGLDYNNAYDQRKIDAMKREFAVAMNNAKEKFRQWYNYHQDVGQEEAASVLYNYLMLELDDMNMIGFMLVLSTPGVYNAWASEFGFDGNEDGLDDSLNCTYNSAIYSLVVATLIAIMQIAIAILSLVFMILAICNLARKKPNKPFKYLFLSLLISGIAAMISMIAPNLIPGGAVMAIGVLSALAYITCGMVAYTKRDNYLVMIRRGVLCLLGLIVFFSAMADSITFYQETYEIGSGGVDYTGSMVDGAFNMGISGLMSYAFIYRLNGLEVSFTEASATSMVWVAALGIATTAVLFAMLLGYLRMLSNPDGKPIARRGTWLMIAGAACMFVLAVGCIILGSIGNIPTEGSTNYMLVKMFAEANSGFYATLVFAGIAIVFDFVYSSVALKNPRPAPAITGDAAATDSVSAPDGAAIAQPESPEQPPVENVDAPTDEQ